MNIRATQTKRRHALRIKAGRLAVFFKRLRSKVSTAGDNGCGRTAEPGDGSGKYDSIKGGSIKAGKAEKKIMVTR